MLCQNDAICNQININFINKIFLKNLNVLLYQKILQNSFNTALKMLQELN